MRLFTLVLTTRRAVRIRGASTHSSRVWGSSRYPTFSSPFHSWPDTPTAEATRYERPVARPSSWRASPYPFCRRAEASGRHEVVRIDYRADPSVREMKWDHTVSPHGLAHSVWSPFTIFTHRSGMYTIFSRSGAITPSVGMREDGDGSGRRRTMK